MSKRIRTAQNKDIGWTHCRPISNDKKKVICNYCNKEMSGGVTRIKEHLAGISGNVLACEQVPSVVKKELLQHMNEKRKQKAETRIIKESIEDEMMNKSEYIRNQSSDDEENEDEMGTDAFGDMRRVIRESRQQFEQEETRRRNQYLGVGSSSGAGLGSRSRSVHQQSSSFIPPTRTDPIFLSKQGSKQPKIKTALKNLKEAKKKIGTAISQFFLFNHIPYNAADSPFYQGMVKTIAEAGPGVKPPTPYEISHGYLDAEVEFYTEYLKTYHSQWDEYGVTLMCDGWTTQNRRNIINFLVYSPAGTVFLKSIDASDHYKNGKYIFGLMKDAVKDIGEKRMVQVVTDNGSNYKAAGQLLTEEFPHIFWTPCAAHCIDLMLEDIAEDPDIRSTILTSQKLTGFIYNHGWALSIMRRETQNGELIRPGITRFATHFIALDSILKHKMDLRRMINSDDWNNYADRLREKDRKTVDEIYLLIHGESYWEKIVNITCIIRPLVKVLRMVDSDDKADMGHLYEAMDRAKEEIKKNVHRGYKKWWAIIDKRWDRQLHRPLHACGTS